MATRQFLRGFLESDDFDTELLQVKRLVARERVGQLFEVEVVAVIPNAETSAFRGESAEDTPMLSKVVGSGVVITFRLMEVDSSDKPMMQLRSKKGGSSEEGGGGGHAAWHDVRQIFGIVQSCTDHVNADTGDVILTMRILPRAHLLAMVETFEVFLEKSLPDIFKAKLEAAGLQEGEDFEFRFNGEYAPLDFTVQYRETDLAFVSRLCEHHGITYFFNHDGGRDKMVFTDNLSGFVDAPEPNQLPVLRSGEQTTVGVFDVKISRQVVESMYVQLDYNYRTPQLDLTSQHELDEAFGGGVVEYANHFRTPEEGARFAQIRGEERRCREVIYTGKSTQSHLLPGHRVALEDDVRFGRAELLVLEVEHVMEQPANLHDASSEVPHYVNQFIAVPSAREFRPRRLTPKPRIHGILHAIIDPLAGGEIGEFSNLDDQGRYTVRFFFDTAGSTRPISSKRVRMIQMHAGLHYGAHMPLKPGIEVMVAFVDGDPDRPVIVGSIPNPVTPSPVTSANSTMNRFKTVSGIIIEMKDRG